MESYWFAAYLVLAGLAIGQSFLLGLQTWEHCRYARSCMRGLDRHQPTGRAAVFAPCKGIDVDLEGNLRALLGQDYDDYEVTFIVDSAEDPAAGLVRRVMAEYPAVPTRLVIAGRATQTGQKVHNLRAGTARLSPDVEYVAFIDSDARPRPEWLRLLLARLCQPGTGAVTGYRWFVPTKDSLANHLLYSMNCDIMSLLGHSSHYLIWGGSWGLRREVFESVDLHGAWAGTLSDDLVASRQLRRAGLRVRFEPGCVVASPLNYSFWEMLSFIRRQYLVARFYVADWWAFAVSATTFSTSSWVLNLAVLGWAVACGAWGAWIPAAAGALLYGLYVYRGWLRQGLVRTYFPNRKEALRRAGRFDIWANPVARLVNWLGVLGSLFGRRITWRGIRYRVLSGGRVRVVRRDDPPARPARHGPAAEPPPQDQPSRRQPDLATPELVSLKKAG